MNFWNTSKYFLEIVNLL